VFEALFLPVDDRKMNRFCAQNVFLPNNLARIVDCKDFEPFFSQISEIHARVDGKQWHLAFKGILDFVEMGINVVYS
jgi:hypothetical protein